MGIIIVPDSPLENRHTFLELLNSPDEYEAVANQFATILAHSFVVEARRSGKEFAKRIQTQHEIKRRSKIIGKWFREMREGLGFSIRRALDEIPKALRTELDGGTYTPPEGNKLWAPGGA